MPTKGDVRVSTSLADIREAVVWLHATRPTWSSARVTLLGSDHGQLVSRKLALQSLIARLQKAVKRKREIGKTHLTFRVPRSEATVFLSTHESALVSSKLSGGKFLQKVGLKRDVERALHGPGRKRLTRGQRANRLSGAISVVDRQKKRVRKADRVAARNQAWSRNLRQRKQTLLTDTEGPPEI